MLGMILAHAPRLSETFIALELESMARSGVRLRLFALGGEGSSLGLPVVAPPARRIARIGAFAWAHLALALRAPRRYTRLLARKVIRRSWIRLMGAGRGRNRMTWSHAREFVLAGWVAEQARSIGVTHLHAHYASGPTAVALLVHELIGLPMSFTAHAKDAYSASPRRLAKKITAARFVVTCSTAVRERLVSLAPERANSIHVIHHGVSPAVMGTDSSRRQGIDGGKDPPLILAAGRLVEKKGFDDLVRALALLQASGVRFRAEIAGEGRLRVPLRSLANQLGLNGTLELPGALPHPVLARRYREAACFVMASRVIEGGNRDGIPNVLLEAMAAGTPVVATPVGGIPEVVADRVTGLLASEGDPKALASCIAEVLEHPADADHRAAQAKASVIARFDLGRNVDRLLLLFRHSGAIPEPHPLRVAYVVKRYPRLSETFILSEILEQERQGTAVHIVSLKKPDEGRFHADLARVRAGVTYLPGYIFPSLGSILGANARWLRRHPRRYLNAFRLSLRGGDRHPLAAFLKASVLADVITARQIELLHAHFATGTAFMAMLASCLTGVPYGFTAHARDVFGQHIDRRALRRKVLRAAYVVAVSEATLRFLREGMGDDLGDRVRRIPNGVHRELLRRPAPALRGGTPLLLGVGRLVEKKGFTHLLAAAGLLKARGIPFRLAVAGDGPLGRTLERQAANLGLETHFLGAIPHGRVLGAMRGARVVVLPAVVAADGDRDVLPTVLLEAQALGRPVVSTRLTGIPEIVDEGTTGYLVDPSAAEPLAEALAEAIAPLLTDRSLAARLGAAGRRRIAEHFDIARSVESLRQCMDEAVARGGGQ